MSIASLQMTGPSTATPTPILGANRYQRLEQSGRWQKQCLSAQEKQSRGGG
jgi:hypothetical protein